MLVILNMVNKINILTLSISGVRINFENVIYIRM